MAASDPDREDFESSTGSDSWKRNAAFFHGRSRRKPRMSTGKARDLGDAQEELNSAVSYGAPVFALVSPLLCVRSTTPDPLIVTGSHDRTARLWDAAIRRPIGEPLIGHYYDVNTAVFSPDGKGIITASLDKTARLWDAATGKPIGAPLSHKAWVFSAAFSPDGKQVVVTASQDNSVRLWQVFATNTQGGCRLPSRSFRAASPSPSVRHSSCPRSRPIGASSWRSGLIVLPYGNSGSATPAPARIRRCPVTKAPPGFPSSPPSCRLCADFGISNAPLIHHARVRWPSAFLSNELTIRAASIGFRCIRTVYIS
jgi:WD40 repeat protein